MKNFVFLIGLIAVVSLQSCYSDQEPGSGIIIVKDQQDFRVPGANVTVSKGIFMYSDVTDNNGEIHFTFTHEQTDISLPAIFDVTAEKSGLTGSGIIRIEPGTETTEEITI